MSTPFEISLMESADLDKDRWAAEHGISTKVMLPQNRWWTSDLQELWTELGKRAFSMVSSEYIAALGVGGYWFLP